VPGFEEGALETLSLDIVTLRETPPPVDPLPRESEAAADAPGEPALAPPELRVAAAVRAPVAPTFAPVAPPVPAFALRGGPSFDALTIGRTSLPQLQPIVRVDPQYPRRALARKIEGTVIVGFTINPDGSTAELEVLDARPAGVFDRSALEAVARWRFAPQPEPRKDSTKFEFELERE
jgi:protein TonB